jgi:uncharacterized protein YcfL
MRKRVAAVVAVTLLVGCESTPTISAEVEGPSLDGGVIFGSGHRSDSTSASTASQSTDATTQEERGGVIFGSGH